MVVLTTTILGKTHRAAVVNGRLHREGDRIVIAGETFRLASVAEDRIELQPVGNHSANARSLIIRRGASARCHEMIASFRAAIFALGSGSLLVAATASRATLCRRTGSRLRRIRALHNRNRESPARIVREVMADEAEPAPPPTATAAPLSSRRASKARPARPKRRPRTGVRQIDSLSKCRPTVGSAPRGDHRSADFLDFDKDRCTPCGNDKAVSSVTRPVVVLKPQERLLASLDRRPTPSAPSADRATGDLVTRIYHPITTSVADLQRLIRPLLTPGVGTLVANADSSTTDGPSSDSPPADGTSGPVVVIVRDRAEVVSQIDAIYADLEAAPKRVVIDALIADVALSDSTPPGWEIEKSRFGVIEAEPRSVLNSLRGTGRVHIIATNQLQVIDRQWASLEWSQGASQPSESRSDDAAPPCTWRRASACVRRSSPAAWFDWRSIRRRAAAPKAFHRGRRSRL